MSIDSSTQRKVGVLLSYLNMALQALIGIIYIPILLQGIGQDEYGLYQLIGSVIAWLSVVGSMFSTGITRYYCKYLSEKDEIAMSNTLAIGKRIYHVASVVVSILGIVGAFAIYIIYQNSISEFQIHEGMFMVGILTMNLIVTMNNSINLSVITAYEKFIFLRFTQIITLVLQPLLVMIAIFFQPYALTVCIVQLLLNASSALIQRYYVSRKLRIKPILHYWDHDLFRGLLSFSAAIIIVMIADQVFYRSNQLIIGYYSGTAVVAVYGIAMQLYNAYMSIGSAASSVFMPRVSEIYFQEKDPIQLTALFIKVGRITTFVLLLVLFGFILFGKIFIELWAGNEYEAAYWIALAIMIPFSIDLVQNLGLTILQVANKYAFRGWVYAVMAIINIVGVLIIVPLYGSIGAAVVTGCCLFVGNGLVMNYYYWKRLGLGIREFWLSLAKLSFPLFLFSFLVYLFVLAFSFEANWILLCSGIIIYIVIYLAIAYLFSMNEYERGLIRSIGERLHVFMKGN